MSGWICRRTLGGVRCNHYNSPRARKCRECHKPRPARRKPTHMRALDLDYAGFVELNGGDACGICGRAPSASRRLDRDHDHKTGMPRGLLCHRCNRALGNWITSEWLVAAWMYLYGEDAPLST